MDALLVYFFKANIALIALYLFYRLFLHKDTFFKEKRFAILLGLIFAIVYPFISILSWIQNSKPAFAISQKLSTTLPEITITAGQKESLTTGEIVLIAYFAIATILLIRIIWHIVSVLLLARNGQKEKLYGQKIIYIQAGTAPFSFFKLIFIQPSDHSFADLEEIIHHEKAHVNQHHTFDVLLSEIICALFWINPCIWLLKNHLRANLEYLADKDVLHFGFDQKSYQYHLLRLSYQQTPAKLGNGFNVSQLKNRIIMMNKKKSSWVGLCKYTLTLPLFAFLLLSANAWSTKLEINQGQNIPVSIEKPTDYKVSLMAQNNVSQAKNNVKVVKEEDLKMSDGEKAMLGVEQMPVFPGGEVALLNFIKDNLKYPASAAEKGIEGRTIIRFIVSKTGYVTDVEVVRQLDPACDAEALRVIKMMPKWIPGREKGKNVAVYYTIPILYKLKKENKDIFNVKKGDPTPLIIIDGEEKSIDYLNDTTKIKPKNIESFSILKDKSATDKYGEKGKNGVVLVKTK